MQVSRIPGCTRTTSPGTSTRSSTATEAPAPAAYADDYEELKKAFELAQRSEESTKLIKEMDKALDEKARERYVSLTDEEIMELLVDKKWYYAIGKGINDLYTSISHKLADRIIELSKRYEETLPDLIKQAAEYEAIVKEQLGRMGLTWDEE